MPLRFPHPEPKHIHPRIRPVFLPFGGCPGRCLYCAQPAQTGAAPARGEAGLAAVRDELAAWGREAAQAGRPPVELGFYGGTFTALPGDWTERFLRLARELREHGAVAAVRCSTRPDAVDPAGLARWRELGLDTVELGVQSFHDDALTASGRGYDAARARAACAAVRAAGLGLGVQLLPGLPDGRGAARPETLLADVDAALAAGAGFLRLYPCQVLTGTGLAGLWRSGAYVPWDLETTVAALAAALRRAWAGGVPVIRLGLAPEPGLEAARLAGPHHPALGQMARSLALFEHVRAQLLAAGRPPARLRYPRRASGEILGQAGALVPAWAGLGLARAGLVPWDEPDFELAWADEDGTSAL